MHDNLTAFRLSPFCMHRALPCIVGHLRLTSHYTPNGTARALNTAATAMAATSSFHDFKPFDKKSEPYDLAQLKGKTVLVVNTASKCGFTPQFDGLEKLYKSVKEKHPDSFEMLGFPCNQFGNQDPGTDDNIQEFCKVNYGVTFPVLKKTNVNGDNAEPVWEWMKREQPGLLGMKRIKWNFEKFLIGPDGTVRGRWASTTKPESLEQPILDVIEKEKPKAEL